MKYIILNDLWYLIKEKYRLILAYIVVFIMYFFLVRGAYVGEYYNILLNNVFGLKFNLLEDAKNIMNLSFILLNYSFYIYLSFIIFVKDLDNLDNLFPRISLLKWLNTKLISQVIISSIINLFIFLVPFLFHYVEFNLILSILKKVLFLEMITILIYIVILLKNKNGILFIILLIGLLLCIFIPINIRSINIIYLLLFNFFSYLMLIILSNYIKFSDLKE